MSLFELIKDREDQRAVEYPFVFQYLPHMHTMRRLDRPKLLDVGCTESDLTKVLAKIGKYEVWACDIRDYDTEGLKIKYVKTDIRRAKFPKRFFDVILAVSVVEHVGLDHYDNKWMDPNGDVETMHMIYRLLKDDGTAIITVDAGKIGTSWYRVYNTKNIGRITNGWKVQQISWFHRHDRARTSWIPCPGEVASSRESKEYADACVCMVLKK